MNNDIEINVLLIHNNGVMSIIMPIDRFTDKEENLPFKQAWAFKVKDHENSGWAVLQAERS